MTGQDPKTAVTKTQLGLEKYLTFEEKTAVQHLLKNNFLGDLEEPASPVEPNSSDFFSAVDKAIKLVDSSAKKNFDYINLNFILDSSY